MRNRMSNLDNNPLRQYFRRPAVFLSLPTGGESYSSDVVEFPDNKELPVYPMTAIDEITTKTPDALFNGSAMVEIIKSCIPAIKDPWKLLSNDLDAVLVAVKAAGGQDSVDVETECPKCKALGTYGVDLLSMLSSLKPGDYETPLQVADLSIKFAPLTYKEMNDAALGQFDIQIKYKGLADIEDDEERNTKTSSALKEITVLTQNILSEAIDFIQTPTSKVEETNYILDFLRQCDSKTYEAIRDYNTKLKSDSTIKPLHIQCVECEHKFDQPFSLNASDFFV
jgi:hypothetical protein